MKICIPIRERFLDKAKKQVAKAQKHADFVEIWLDCFGPEQAGHLIKHCRKPVIAVCRAKTEKGRFNGSEKDRINMLKIASASGARFVDVGIHTDPALLKNLKKICRKHGAEMIVSRHIWDGTPGFSELFKLAAKMKKAGADIVKIAVFVKRWPDNVILFELTKRISESGGKIIAIGMGEKGKISRIGCPLLGSFLTYAALDEKGKTAPGQLLLKEF